jgi:RsiW-degrading membrane proteinase PrsW (M82 family)
MIFFVLAAVVAVLLVLGVAGNHLLVSGVAYYTVVTISQRKRHHLQLRWCMLLVCLLVPWCWLCYPW